MPTSDLPENNNLTLGIDVGTSGIRGVLITKQNQIRFQHQEAMPFPEKTDNLSQQNPQIWINTLEKLFSRIQQSGLGLQIEKCVLDATSSTVLICKPQGTPLTQALMYDDRRAQNEAQQIAAFAPKESGAHGASSTLAKVLWLEKRLITQGLSPEKNIICHQIDFLNHYLTGQLNITDENNALKLGYDSIQQKWPNWCRQMTRFSLPQVVAPGTFLAKLQSKVAERFQFNPNMKIYAGTTDSIAAFLASGANKIGDAVTSLGSTLAIKQLTSNPIFAPQYGIYSHHLKGKWLVGGASNSGGAVLLHQFELARLKQLLPKIDLNQPSGLNYYPLNTVGERFPINDPNLPPKITPRPERDEIFLQGLLEGLTAIEVEAYRKLNELGADPVKRIYSCGGGTKNAVWMAMRKKALPAETKTASNTDAAFGVTQLLTN